MFNRSLLVGRLVRDPELKKTTTGKSVVSITVACEFGFGDKKRTDFVNCQAWNHQADFIGNYLLKGSLVGIEGRIQSRSYDDSSGRKVYIQEVLVDTVKSLGGRNDAQQQSEPSYSNTNEPWTSTSEDDDMTLDIVSDELPF